MPAGEEAPPDEVSSDEEEGEAALSKRAAKKQRKRELNEAEAIAETPITSGFGHRMLMKMGWDGDGSGLREDGIAEPVKAAAPVGKRGLAAEDDGSGAGAEPMPKQADVAAPSKVGSKRARQEATSSRTWQVELELSAPMDEEKVRTAMLGVPNVIWVPRLEMVKGGSH